MKYIINFTLGIILVIIFTDCSNIKISSPQFLKKYYDTQSNMKQYFMISSICNINDSISGYDHKFNFWIGLPICNTFISNVMISGKLFFNDSIIYLIPSGGDKPIEYFNFKMKPNESRTITFQNKRVGYNCDTIYKMMNYKLQLLDSEYSKLYKEIIYKFIFRNINAVSTNDDLIFYIGIHCGPIGIFNGNIEIDNYETIEFIYSFKGDIKIGELLKYRRKFDWFIQ